MRLPHWKACVIVGNDDGRPYGLWLYVRAEDADAAAENAEQLTGGEIVMVQQLTRHPRTIAERIAA